MERLPDNAPVFPEARIGLVKPHAPVRAPLVESYIATIGESPNFVRHVSFDVGDTSLEGSFLAGQSFGVLPPGTDEKGNPYKLRLYSVSSPSRGEGEDGRRVSTLVKRMIEEESGTHRLYSGVCSNYLCDLQVGEEALLTGPTGKRFLLPIDPGAHHYVFFATGTGVAPFRAMILDLLAAGARSRIHLIVGVPYSTDYLYHDLFTDTMGKLPGLSYRAIVSREERRQDGSKRYVHHQIGDDPALRDTLGLPNTLIYVCGIRNMETGIYRELLRAGLGDYLELRGLPEDADPLALGDEALRRHIRPGPRIFLDEY